MIKFCSLRESPLHATAPDFVAIRALIESYRWLDFDYANISFFY